MSQEPSLITAEALKQFCRNLLAAAGLSHADAELVADSLVEANLRGIDSHGVARLPHYLARLAQGSIKPRPQMNMLHPDGDLSWYAVLLGYPVLGI